MVCRLIRFAYYLILPLPLQFLHTALPLPLHLGHFCLMLPRPEQRLHCLVLCFPCTISVICPLPLQFSQCLVVWGLHSIYPSPLHDRQEFWCASSSDTMSLNLLFPVAVITDVKQNMNDKMMMVNDLIFIIFNFNFACPRAVNLGYVNKKRGTCLLSESGLTFFMF